MPEARLLSLITFKYISCIDFVFYVIKAGIIAVGDDGFALGLELIEVVDDLRAKERFAIRNSWLINDDLGTLGLDTLAVLSCSLLVL